MNLEKAKEFFSSYHEGTLERGIRQSFESALANDPEIRAEYRAFEETVAQLEALREVPIEIPEDLHERVSARLDRHLWEQKRKRTPKLTAWWRSIAIAGVASVAMIGAVLQFNSRGDAVVSSVVPTTQREQLNITADERGVVLSYESSQPRQIEVRRFDDGRELLRSEVSRLRSPLTNSAPDPVLVTVELSGQPQRKVIALPGTQRVSVSEGQGTIADFAKALAGFYNRPVVLMVKDLSQSVSWNFESTDPIVAVENVLESARFAIEERASGIIGIQEH
jgi:hypothetical protein